MRITKKLAGATLASALLVPLAAAPSSAASEESTETVTSAAAPEVAIQAIAPFNPSTQLDRGPSGGGSWVGPTAATNPSTESSVVTDQVTAAAVGTAIISIFNPPTGFVLANAVTAYGATAEGLFTASFNYVESSPVGPSLETARVTYFYEDSRRDWQDGYLGYVISYDRMTER